MILELLRIPVQANPEQRGKRKDAVQPFFKRKFKFYRKGGDIMIKKFTSIAAALAILSMFAFTGCQKQEGQKGGMPEKTAPTTTPSGPGGK